MDRAADNQSIDEIHVDKMHFRVVNKHPQQSEKSNEQKKQCVRNELYHVFEKYW